MLAAEKQAAIHAAVAINVGPLVIENQALKRRVAQLSQTVLTNAEVLADERLRYVKEIEKLNLDNATRLHTSNELKKSNDELKAEIVHLKTIIADQQSKIDAQTVRIDAQTVQIDGLLKREKAKDAALARLMRRTARLMRRENLITAREAMRALERFICLETVGAKPLLRKEKSHTISAIEARPELKLKLPRWVTPEVLVELRKSKHAGNSVVHDSPFTRDDVVKAFADADPDREALKTEMLKMLDACYKLHSLPFGAPLKL